MNADQRRDFGSDDSARPDVDELRLRIARLEETVEEQARGRGRRVTPAPPSTSNTVLQGAFEELLPRLW
jgi:hypothetical protein